MNRKDVSGGSSPERGEVFSAVVRRAAMEVGDWVALLEEAGGLEGEGWKEREREMRVVLCEMAASAHGGVDADWLWKVGTNGKVADLVVALEVFRVLWNEFAGTEVRPMWIAPPGAMPGSSCGDEQRG